MNTIEGGDGNGNISFFLDNPDNNNSNDDDEQSLDFSQLMHELDSIGSHSFSSNSFGKVFQSGMDDLYTPYTVNYSMNYTVKDLYLICDYYGISKEMKANKFKKEQIIQTLINFEANPLNADIVCKRQNMWFYMNELKSDVFMKKFLLW